MNKIKFSFFVALVIMTCSYSFAQTSAVKGVITDADNMPLPGVSVQIKNSTVGTSSDFGGQYQINASQGDILIFSFLGFKTREMTVNGDVLNVSLEEDAKALDEVVVTAFGRKLTRNESTSSVSTVSAEELTKQHFTDVTQSLQGKVTGMVVNASSGTPGAPPVINIRGINSVTASNSPLFVIDGVPVNDSDLGESNQSGTNSSMNIMSLIGSGDIESVTVLKDASAVAPYGADGANGVILITTKSGKSGDARYSFSSTLGFNNDAIKGPKMANSLQKLDAMQEAIWNSFGPELGDGTINSRDQVYGLLKQKSAFLEDWENRGRPYTDWRKEISVSDAIMYDVNFAVTQGSEKSNFYASVGYNQTDGTVVGSDYKKLTGSLKFNTNLNDKLNLALSVNVANVRQNSLLENSGWFSNPNYGKFTLSPWASLRDENGDFRYIDFRKMAAGRHNVVFTALQNEHFADVTRGIQNSKLEYKITDKLTFKTILGLDFTLRHFKNNNGPLHGDGEDPNGETGESNLTLFNYTTQNSFDYKFKIGEKHNFLATGLYEYTKYKDLNLYGYGANFPNEGITNLSGATSSFFAESTYSDQMKMRWVGLLNYNFEKKYLADLSYSYQGDSRFSEKWDSFYSMGLGWNLQEEDFIKNIETINVLRLRVGFGLTGNAGIGRNLYQTLMTYNIYNNGPAAVVSGYGTNAKWEKSKRFDMAASFELFNYRLKGSIGVYVNNTSDMLFNVPLPYSAQLVSSRVLQNLGEMKNAGIELELGGDLISTPDFNWNLSGNLSTFSNKVTSLPQDAEIVESTRIVQEGRKVYEWYMPEWAGVEPSNGLPLWYVDRANGDNSTTSNYSEAKRQHIGANAFPTYQGSISTSVTYKKLFFETSMYFSGGNKLYENSTMALYARTTNGSRINSFSTSADVVENAWRTPGDIAKYPRFDWNDSRVANAASQRSTKHLYDGTYMRLRDVGIGYNFSDINFVKSLGIDALNVSLRGTNLWTVVKDKSFDWDPESTIADSDGFTTLKTPPVKAININVNINF
ncbi:SusC/RagA family TonB-linked outer membrane protein [Gelidibacter sp.]|uniref:SusC/RagA family TonB-linked outer membrane protein n=1 Tax=Gelidibacter sp. TaxID=2018083 RepID=UPI002C39E84E|nr:SusC/RagA family TonB-linked outer membrane protein [Gelidibacter sp.]HUH27509.1 SusC/RagA family TonB-linked outer membrane protein [Gelidibacter sp.]